MRIFKKPVVSSIILIFSFIMCHGQVQSSLSPNLITFPVSPEAARMQTYGNLPINLFYGQMNKSVELYNGKIGDFNLPVNLIYNYAGFRIDETPSVMGLGWQLSVGGTVSREVKALPDSYPNNYYTDSYFKTNVLNKYFNEGTMNDLDAQKIIDGRYDSEPDKYTISVNGINFSFKIGLNGQPVYLSKHNYKIEFIRDLSNNNEINSFILTDTNANRYYFEDVETTLQTGGIVFSDPYSNFDLLHPVYNSSWQLTRIRTNNGSDILFQYEENDFNSYSYYCSGTYRGLISDGPADWHTLYEEGCNQFLITRKILSSIICENFKIDLINLEINSFKVNTKLEIKDFLNRGVSSYDFEYSGYRNLLTQIKKNNQFFQGFEYYGNQIPRFINSPYEYPRNQDEWGFGNGANNAFFLNIPSTQYVADRRPNFGATVTGALRKIIYSTGGETEIFYEQNRIYDTIINFQEVEPNVRLLLKFKSDNINNETIPTFKEKVYTKTFETGVVATLQHRIESHAAGNIVMEIKRIPDICSSSIYSVPNQYYIKVPNERANNNNYIPTVCPLLHDALDDGYSGSSMVISRDSGGKFVIPAGTYEFKFSTDQNRYKDVKGEIQLDFYDATVVPLVPERLVGGIRVAKTIDRTNQQEIINYYDYTDKDGKPSGKLFSTLIDSFSYRTMQGHLTVDGMCVSTERDCVDYNFKSYNQIFNSGTPAFYTSVKEYTTFNNTFISTSGNPHNHLLCNNCQGIGGSNYDSSEMYSYLNGQIGYYKKSFPKGYKLTNFINPSQAFDANYPFSPSGEDLSKGIVEDSKVFGSLNSDSTNDILKEEHSNYWVTYNGIQVDSNYPVGLVLGYKKKRIGCFSYFNTFNVHDYYLFKTYSETDNQKFLSSTISMDYFNEVAVVKNTTIKYDSYFQEHLVTTTNSTNDVLTDEIFHPYDFDDTDSQSMVLKNFISPIVKVESKKNDVLTETTKYDYGQIGANLFKPFSFWKSKGTEELEKTMEYGYDIKGNINLVKNVVGTVQIPPHTLTIGPTKKIVWGYNQSQPVAVIENVPLSGVPQGLISSIQQLTDDPNATEEDVLSALNALRNDSSLSESMVTTYTYVPLIGVSTITDPRGQTTYYEYDSFGRLILVRDAARNPLSSNNYHYQTQN